MRLAFFDDYAQERRHHPDLILGLGAAAHAPIYCPDSFLEGQEGANHFLHHTVKGSQDGSRLLTRRNLEWSCQDAAALGCEAVVNLFFDENWDSFPIESCGMRVVHALHRPGELTGMLGGVNATKTGNVVGLLKSLAGEDLFVVHTSPGAQLAARWLPIASIAQVGWPAATISEVRSRFAATPLWSREEPYALLIGAALDYKGIPCLLEAVSDGPLVRIGGNLACGGPEWLAREYPSASVTWEPGWITRARMDELIRHASVIVFPYVPGFMDHGGVSGALIDALTFAKPVVISEALACQVPRSDSCRVVPCDDAASLRRAIDWAMANTVELQEAARELESYVIDEHTYERHVERIVERVRR